MLSALGAYDSDSDADGEAAQSAGTHAAKVAASPVAANPVAQTSAAVAKKARTEAVCRPAAAAPEVHGATCSCEDCERLLERFAAKSLQTKGIRFKCKLCGETMARKETSSAHFQQQHRTELQGFKREKNPKLFQAKPKAAAGKISFAREDILGKKRPRDADEAFGGWTKKEKPEPPPCEQPDYEEQMSQPILIAPPWESGSKPSNEDATQMDKEVDGHIAQAQVKRFCKRNTMEVRAGSCRCKLCFKIIGSVAETEKHIIDAHEQDFKKEMSIWERFCLTTCRRQPPFGWVCKVCNLFFPSDADVWRHLGKEVFIRLEERHLTNWHDREDRWGHEEDEECCGDGMNSGGGLSLESVQAFNQAAAREEALKQAKTVEGPAPRGDGDDSDEEDTKAAAEIGVVKEIREF